MVFGELRVARGIFTLHSAAVKVMLCQFVLGPACRSVYASKFEVLTLQHKVVQVRSSTFPRATSHFRVAGVLLGKRPQLCIYLLRSSRLPLDNTLPHVTTKSTIQFQDTSVPPFRSVSNIQAEAEVSAVRDRSVDSCATLLFAYFATRSRTFPADY
jgi:hypothetical protein